LQDLLADEGRRAALEVAARRRALERYSLERMVRDYAAVLESLV
jgi:glycosyltransferase involved in cell wall biosynthesis